MSVSARYWSGRPAVLLAARLTAPLLALAVVAAVLGPVGTARAAYATTLVNFDSGGQRATRYDTAGNAVDAHDGVLAVFGDTYYLYGTSYGCGYGLLVTGTRFCGFKVYSSPDLVHWTDRGALFEASRDVWQQRCAAPAFGCYRPHV